MFLGNIYSSLFLLYDTFINICEPLHGAFRIRINNKVNIINYIFLWLSLLLS